MLIVREFRPDDLDACVQIFVAVYALPPWNESWSMRQARAYLSELIRTPGFMGFVASADDGVRGGLLGHMQHWSGGMEYVIDEIWVDPPMQGSGIGTQLLDQAKREVARSGAHDMVLWTHAEAPATHFYASCGFTELTDRRFFKLILPDSAQ